MPDFQFGFADLAVALGSDVVGTPLSEEIGVNLQLTTKGLMIYTAENGPTFVKTRNTASITPGTPPIVPGAPMLIQDIIHKLPRANPMNLAKRTLAQINRLVIHWDGGALIPEGYDPLTYYVSEANYHIKKDWGGGSFGTGIMYHYKVSRQGGLYKVRPETDVVWAAMSANTTGLMLCVDATEGQPPTQAQLVMVDKFANWVWTQRPDLPNLVKRNIWGHGELVAEGNSTSCPGPALLTRVKALRAS